MISSLIVHRIGHKLVDESLRLSKNPVPISDELEAILSEHYLSSFPDEQHYHFHHDTDLNLNEIYSYANSIFDTPDEFIQQSVNIAKHLYNKSDHPKIKNGELHVAYFSNLFINGETVDAIGLFKSETTDTFLEVEDIVDGFRIDSKQGIFLRKIDKGCIIYNTQAENGYLLSIIDHTNKGNEAQYWKDEFLSVMIVNNSFHQTNEFMGIAKNFVTKRIDEDFEMSKADKIDLLNRSVDYFKSRDHFDKEEFEEEVFHDNNIIKSFRRFDETYRKENALEISDNFEISTPAVKKQVRVFKSVLKLDKNFHIYIHGDRKLIQQGVDDDGRKYYKIYYDQEV